MLPLTLLQTTVGHPMLVELKSGETLNGHLTNCDTWMNLTLKEVVSTSAEGDVFWKLKESYIRGSNIKYLRIPPEIIDIAKQQQASQQSERGGRGGRGGFAARGGERGGRGGGGRGGAERGGRGGGGGGGGGGDRGRGGERGRGRGRGRGAG